MGKDAWKGCQAACKSGNPPANGFEYLENLPRGSQVLLETDYRLQEQFQEDILDPTEDAGLNPLLMAVFALAAIMIFFYLKNQK